MLSQFISLCNTIKNIYTNPLKRTTMAIVQVQQNKVFETFFFFFAFQGLIWLLGHTSQPEIISQLLSTSILP